jgi:DNA ligase-1
MINLAEACERIAATTKKLEKTAIVADYLKSRTPEEASIASVFLSGRPFPVWEETTLQVGASLLWRIVAELSVKSEAELTAAYRQLGDLGAVTERVFGGDRAGTGVPARPDQAKAGSPELSAPDVARYFRQIAAARGATAKSALVRELLSSSTPLEAKYIVKIMTGDLRIGLKESLVEEAIARAYGATLREVQRANMLLGDIGETLKLAAAGKLDDAKIKMRMFHPLGFMLASPAESAEQALSYFPNALVEDKYDGIRAQAHCSNGEVRLFSRTRDEITESFPELPAALAGIPGDVILDGEIVAWSNTSPDLSADLEEAAPASRRLSEHPARRAEGETYPRTGSALPFSALQQRLGRKQVSEKLMRQVPVAYLAFDVLYAGGQLLLEHPLLEREKILDALLAAPRKSQTGRRGPVGTQAQFEFGEDAEAPNTQVIRAPVARAFTPQELDQLFEAAQARGNEGLMIKDPASAYTPGRRGKSWLKLKRELATLDVVVTAVEYGHGKRIGVLSDYTFAVRDGEKLVNIGKAYSGLTDVEIAQMTKWFLEHTVEDQGFRRVVEPKIVLEVAFNNMMESGRHESGYALRFPRIVRLRPDKLPEEADTIERVREIYEKQSGGSGPA